MAKFAPVVPIGLAQWLKKEGVLGDYHLLLAHDVLAHPKKYAEVYSDIAEKGGTVIMDNSLIELGEAMPMDRLSDACHIVNATHLVMPDKLLDRKATYNMTVEAFDECLEALPMIEPILVIQGQDVHDCVYLFDSYLRLLGGVRKNGTFSVPRAVGNAVGSRRKLCAFVNEYNGAIHLLGFSNNLLDDVACARMPGVIGIDSTEPIRLALQKGFQMSLDWPANPGPRSDYWEHDWVSYMESMHPFASGILKTNLRLINEWITVKSKD